MPQILPFEGNGKRRELLRITATHTHCHFSGDHHEGYNSDVLRRKNGLRLTVLEEVVAKGRGVGRW